LSGSWEWKLVILIIFDYIIYFVPKYDDNFIDVSVGKVESFRKLIIGSKEMKIREVMEAKVKICSSTVVKIKKNVLMGVV
jgi:hypothetical protein